MEILAPGLVNFFRTSAKLQMIFVLFDPCIPKQSIMTRRLLFFQTGSQQGNRPSMGSWVSYGLGSENKNLPDFCVLLSKGPGNGQGVYSKLWSNGFLDSIHQGVQFSSSEHPVLYLQDPNGMSRLDRRKNVGPGFGIESTGASRVW